MTDGYMATANIGKAVTSREADPRAAGTRRRRRAVSEQRRDFAAGVFVDACAGARTDRAPGGERGTMNAEAHFLDDRLPMGRLS